MHCQETRNKRGKVKKTMKSDKRMKREKTEKSSKRRLLRGKPGGFRGVSCNAGREKERKGPKYNLNLLWGDPEEKKKK